MIIGVDYKQIFDDSGATQLKRATDMIAAELELLFNFKKYSMFFGNNMGLDLEKYIGLRNRTATFNLVKADIQDVLAKYGRVVLKSLKVNFDSSNSALLIDLTVSMPGLYYNNDITIPIKVAS